MKFAQRCCWFPLAKKALREPSGSLLGNPSVYQCRSCDLAVLPVPIKAACFRRLYGCICNASCVTRPSPRRSWYSPKPRHRIASCVPPGDTNRKASAHKPGAAINSDVSPSSNAHGCDGHAAPSSTSCCRRHQTAPARVPTPRRAGENPAQCHGCD